MKGLHQVIVGNSEEKGLDILASTLQKNQILDIGPFLPKFRPLNFNGVFLTKFQYIPAKIMLQFTFDSETDHFGRDCLRTHTFIIDEDYYNEKTALYIISPLLNGRMDPYNEVILTENDFSDQNSSSISSKMLELCLCNKFIPITNLSEINQKELILDFATLDRAIPPPFISSFSFQTMVNLDEKILPKKRSMIFSYETMSNSIILERLKREESEFSTIKTMSENINDITELRGLQKKLFSEISEKRLRMKLQWRFGVKHYSHVRENLSDYFP